MYGRLALIYVFMFGQGLSERRRTSRVKAAGSVSSTQTEASKLILLSETVEAYL